MSGIREGRQQQELKRSKNLKAALSRRNRSEEEQLIGKMSEGSNENK